MIRVLVTLENGHEESRLFDQSVVTIGRLPHNDIAIPADNISSNHGRIEHDRGFYRFRDNNSTNGSIVIRGEQRFLLDGDEREIELQIGDTICLASLDNQVLIEDLGLDDDQPLSGDFGQQTIIAEVQQRGPGFDDDLDEDSPALRAAVGLARELMSLEDPRAISKLACKTLLKAFPNARRALFLIPQAGGFQVSEVESREGADTSTEGSTALRSRQLLDRCLKERKGFLYVLEQNQVQAIATMIGSIEQMRDDAGSLNNKTVICSPLYNRERCYGFLEVEAPLLDGENALERRDLSLTNLVAHLVAGRLYDLENQRERLKVARKATAGFMSAMVGHCFKNLLFVPMSLGKMLPLCVRQGKMQEVEWMLARNTVNIRYLDILSNEFAAASKDPTEGFSECQIGDVVREAAQLVNGIAPEKVEAKLEIDEDLPLATIHGAAIKRTLMNLTLNAVDALFGQNRAGGDKGIIRIAATHNADNDRIEMIVEDNGPGIPDEVLENLRSIYVRISRSADALSELQSIAEQVKSTKDQGFKEHYGLGFLFICQTIHMHEGSLRIQSEPGKGSAFYIEVPRLHKNVTLGDTNA